MAVGGTLERISRHDLDSSPVIRYHASLQDLPHGSAQQALT